MLKELKNLFYIIVIILFFFITLKYYFSDSNFKNSYRSYEKIDDKVILYSLNLPLLGNDTKSIIEYVEQTKNPKKKKYNFLELLDNE